MPENKNYSRKGLLIEFIKDLYYEYENKEKVGICFKLQRNKNPLDVIGVLDFLKYKIKKWGNSNIFSYQGKLFNDKIILVIGSNNAIEAKDIIIFIFLNQIHDNIKVLLKTIEEVESNNDIEQYIDQEIINNLVEGFPNDRALERELQNHLQKLLKEA
ncbi:MAG: hypothetical protein ACFE8E_09470 [Candidatus Hodarchaeota archaeon]